MANFREEKPKSFAEFVSLIEKELSHNGSLLWFRGCGRSDYKLLPTLYRHPSLSTLEEYAKLEQDLMTRFRQRSLPFHNRSLQDDWDTLFFMQHYGIPTRLLDWTENPFIALYFAVMSCPHELDEQGKIQFTNMQPFGYLILLGGIVIR
jgi:hypothetical protein